MTDGSDLPTWDGPRGGSGCDNDDCDATDQFCRVLSREEIERVYIQPERLPMWPLPEPFTHMCTKCGQAYAGYSDPPGFDHEASIEDRPPVPLDEWDWDPSDGWELPVRDAVEAFVDGAPSDAVAAQVAEGVDRHVPGASAELARDVLADTDSDVTADPVDEYL